MWLSDIVAKVENKYRTSLSTVLDILSTAVATYDDGQEPVEDINPRYVLHLVWNPLRLWRTFMLSKKGKKLAPIDVTQITWHDHSFYIIRDGNHRTAVAILQGKKIIRAKIKEKRYPGSYSLRKRWCWAHPLMSAQLPIAFRNCLNLQQARLTVKGYRDKLSLVEKMRRMNQHGHSQTF